MIPGDSEMGEGAQGGVAGLHREQEKDCRKQKKEYRKQKIAKR